MNEDDDPDADLFDGTDLEPGSRGLLDRHAYDTEKAAREQVHARACKEFDRFVVTKEREGQWRCATPGSFAYSFRVLLCPGTVVWTGDCGDLILRTSLADPLEWLKSTFLDGHDELDYFCRKASRELQERTWMPGEAVAEVRLWLADKVADLPDAEEWPEKRVQAEKAVRTLLHDVLEDLSLADEGEHEKAWYEAWSKLNRRDIDSVPDPTFWSTKMLWAYEGLRWFVLQIGPDGK